nr:DUF4251 domain-containing protein [uncultured Allomuricauda sp.]
MRTFHTPLFLIFLLMVFGCGSQKQIVPSAAQVEALNAIVEDRAFVIDITVARPLATGAVSRIANSGLLPPGSNVSRIDLTGMSSYLRVTNDSVFAEIPYYGERQLPTTYNANNTGVQFKNIPEDFEIAQNNRTHGYTVRFNVGNGTEAFAVIAEIFPDLSSTVNVNSSHRTPIWYSGEVEKLTME